MSDNEEKTQQPSESRYVLAALAMICTTAITITYFIVEAATKC